MTGRHRPGDTPSWQFRCKFYGSNSRNNRQLEDRVVRDQEGAILTARQRNSTVKRLDCPVEYYLSKRLVNRYSEERIYKGIWRQQVHQTHEFPLNPFSFSAHEKSIQSYQRQSAQALTLRSVEIPYCQARQLLEEKGNGLVISSRTYYNVFRHQQPN